MRKLTWFSTIVFTMVLFLTVDVSALMTGNDWRTLKPTEQDMYLVGVYQGWEPVAGIAQSNIVGPPSALDRIFMAMLQCVQTKQMTYAQLAAMTRQFMENNPSLWHKDMTDIIFMSVQTVCPHQFDETPDGNGKKSLTPKIRSGKNRF